MTKPNDATNRGSRAEPAEVEAALLARRLVRDAVVEAKENPVGSAACAPGRRECRATGLEAQVQQIWEDVLGISPVGRDQEFFSLGGDSLRAIQIAFEVEVLVGRELPFDVFANCGSVRTLTLAVERALASGVGLPAESAP